jgi:hypothetical protein
MWFRICGSSPSIHPDHRKEQTGTHSLQPMQNIVVNYHAAVITDSV